ncbi:hypothetical protein OGAPHI_002827 [Ogataea philodendri]|uniref:Uncharacterized protein n=1 Tax=Ogataea philodendri TaxID=1378263 RepID=A0A9P8P7H3_9ASCO|nr:uncharacterized protein OGAPHI_002827 [Ogataea philodendri]KAH3667178.1 hypothetical protein OGAPHI_002827 [Ogataea philodendri]
MVQVRHQVLVLIVSCHGDNWSVHIKGSDHRGGRCSIEVGHDNVHQNEVELHFFEHVDRSQSVSDNLHCASVLHEELAAQLDTNIVVLHQKNMHTGSRWPSDNSVVLLWLLLLRLWHFGCFWRGDELMRILGWLNGRLNRSVGMRVLCLRLLVGKGEVQRRQVNSYLTQRLGNDTDRPGIRLVYRLGGEETRNHGVVLCVQYVEVIVQLLHGLGKRLVLLLKKPEIVL